MRVLRRVAPAAAAALGALAAIAAPAGVVSPALPAAPARAPAAIPDPIEFDRWIRVESEHLVIYSNAPEDPTIDVGRHVEVFRDQIARFNPDLRVDSALPIVLFVFRDDRTFIPYKLLGRGQRAGMAANIDGFFLQHDDGNYLCVNATPANDPWPVIYHEYAHFFLANNFTDIPLWLNEGLAEYFGTFRVDGSEAMMGGPIKSHLWWLREHPPMALRRLFSIDFASPEYHEDDRQGTYYAQSWAVTHYLLWGTDGPGGGMDRFLSDRKRGDSLAAAVAPFTANPGEREERFLQYLNAKKFPFHTVPLGDRSGAPAPKVTALTRDEAYYRLGDLLRHVDPGRLEAAAEHFRAALRLQPERADAHAGLGQTLFELGRRDEARVAFEKAYTLAPDDPRIGLRFGLSLVESSFPADQRQVVKPEALPADLLRGRAILEKLVGREPANALAWGGLGTSYAFDGGDVAPGIAALEKARALLPSRPELAVNLCWLYLRGGGLEKVRPLYEQVVRTSDDKRARAEGLEAVFWADYEMAAAAPADE
ncbi:MAG TPA: tetratricopeptide repeat protein, partial [Dongiaceae bacterium]|nr:tetratricopeptide repeat protein [Dongiaceae bacterium]